MNQIVQNNSQALILKKNFQKEKKYAFLKGTIRLLIFKGYTFYPEKDMSFVSYVKHQVKVYLSIFNSNFAQGTNMIAKTLKQKQA